MSQGQFYFVSKQKIEPGHVPAEPESSRDSILRQFGYRVNTPAVCSVGQRLHLEILVYAYPPTAAVAAGRVRFDHVRIYRRRSGTSTLIDTLLKPDFSTAGVGASIRFFNDYLLDAAGWQEGDMFEVIVYGLSLDYIDERITIGFPPAIYTQTYVVDVSPTTVFDQEAVAATDANGTTWVDILDRSTITKPVKICGFMVTVAGAWAGNAEIRIVDGASNKIFPFQDEYVQGTDFASGVQAVFNFPVEVSVNSGYKFQFRSSAAGDGAGETLQLNNLDIMEIG